MEIRTYRDPVLLKAAAPVTKFDSDLKTLADDMYRCMIDADGVGLAAPQVGISLQIFVVDTQESRGLGRLTFVNPEIEILDPTLCDMREGCLSIPEVYAVIARPTRVRITAKRVNGMPITLQSDGLLARVIQHEYDPPSRTAVP